MANEQKPAQERDTPATGTPQQGSPEEERPRRTTKEIRSTPEDARRGYEEPDVGAGEK